MIKIKFLSALLDQKIRPDAEAVKEALLAGYPANADFQYDWTLNSIQNKK